MSPEKDAALCEKYPKIFRDRHASMQETCMCWGFDCGDGWYDLIDCLCANIQSHVDWQVKSQKYKIEGGKMTPEDAVPEDDMQVVATQVKEKFGGLRFYTNGCDPEVNGMISVAESLSQRICETCGHPGSAKGTGWVYTMCDACWDAFQAKRAAASQVLSGEKSV
jgi:hypothetical protein